MKISNALNRLSKFVLLPLCLLTIAFQSQAAIFIKLGDIQGESNDRDHQNWIDVLSVSEGIHFPSGDTSGTTRIRGSAVFDDIGIGKELDKSSPRLREALARGEVLPKVEIEITASCDGARVVYFRYELTNVLLTSISLNASGNETAPTEDFSLNFEEIKWTYTILENDCSTGGKVEANWAVDRGE